MAASFATSYLAKLIKFSIPEFVSSRPRVIPELSKRSNGKRSAARRERESVRSCFSICTADCLRAINAVCFLFRAEDTQMKPIMALSLFSFEPYSISHRH